MKKYKKQICNICLLFGIGLNLSAAVWGMQNYEQMMPGFEYFLTAAVIMLTGILLCTNMQMGVSIKKLLSGILLTIFICSAIMVRIVCTGQWNQPRNSYTVLNYFSKTGGRSLQQMADGYDSYSIEWAIILNDIFSGKKVYIDKELMDEQLLVPLINGTDYIEADEDSIYSNTDLEDIKDSFSGQKIWAETEEGETREWYLLTGSIWEQSKSIHIINTGNTIFALPDQIYNQMERVKSVETDRNRWNIESVRMDFHMDETIYRVLGEGRYKWQLVFKNFAYMCFIFISGLVPLLFIENKKGSITRILLLAFPVGTMIQIFLTFFLSISGVLKNIWIVLAANLLIEGLTVAGLWKRGYWKRLYELSQRKNRSLLGALLGIMLFFSLIPQVFFTYDSYCNILIGKQIALNGGCREILGRLIMFSLVSTNLQAEAALFGIPLNYAFQPVFTVIGTGLILYLQSEFFIYRGMNKKWAWLLSILSGFAFVVTPQYILGSSWILNNLSIGIWYGAAFGCLEKYRSEKTNLLLFVSVFFFMIAGIARIEGGVFAVIYLVLLLKTDEVSDRFKLKVSLGFTALYGVLFFLYYMMIESMEEGFWTPANGGMSLALLIVFDIYAVSSRKIKKSFKLFNHLEIIMSLVLVMANIAIGLCDTEKFVLTVQNFLINIISTGYYGILLSVGIGILALRIRSGLRFETGLRLMNAGISYILLIILMMQLSVNHTRIGYGDSACRMFLHIVPTIGLGISACFGEIFEIQRKTVYEEKCYE